MKQVTLTPEEQQYLLKILNNAANHSNVIEQTPNNGETPLQEIENVVKHMRNTPGYPNDSEFVKGYDKACDLILYRIDKLKKDNPVGQVFTAKDMEMLTLILNSDTHLSVENRNYFLNKLRSINKPLETDKEQPKIYGIINCVVPCYVKGLFEISHVSLLLTKPLKDEKELGKYAIEECKKMGYDYETAVTFWKKQGFKIERFKFSYQLI